jgi:hypothetical protein
MRSRASRRGVSGGVTDAPADEGKRTAAEAAVALVENGMQLGLGIGLHDALRPGRFVVYDIQAADRCRVIVENAAQPPVLDRRLGDPVG